MKDATTTAVDLDFPELPQSLTSSARRRKQRAMLAVTTMLRFVGPLSSATTGILTYHRVSEDPGPDPAMLNVTPKCFRRQLEGLLDLAYRPLRLSDLVAKYDAGKSLSSRDFVVVFDDGYQDIYRNAWPVLSELQIPATIFLATRYLENTGRFPFDDWSQDIPATARPLNVGECREMARSGWIDFGSHTHSHLDFRNRPDAFRRDVMQSLDILHDAFGATAPALSFPYGFAGESLVEICRELHLSAALTAECRSIALTDDRFDWGRYGATQLDSPRTLAAKLDGWYAGCRRLRERLRRR